MLTDVMILASLNLGFAWGLVALAGFMLLSVLMNLIFGFGAKHERDQDRHDSIGTKLRRFRDCRDVRCGREECQAWNTRRARYCRLCGSAMK